MNDDRMHLDGAYAHCRRVHRWHGRTFYRATKLLPARSRRHVSALYSFARYADDIVDEPEWAGHRHEALATIDPMHQFELGMAPFDRFFAAMERDLDHTPFADWSGLLESAR